MANETATTDGATNLNAPHERALKEALTPSAAPDDPAKYGVEGCCVHEFWAVVERDGTLVRGRNVVRTVRLAPGQYAVFFTADVTQAVYVATIGRPGIATEPAGMIGVALRCCPDSHSYLPFETNKGVWIDTHDPNGTFSDRAFHLVVLNQ